MSNPTAAGTPPRSLLDVSAIAKGTGYTRPFYVRGGVPLQWLGHVDEMAALFATIDIVVLPSYREGLPTALIEAAACDLALVTCDTRGCRDVVTDGVDGLLVPPRDADAAAAAVARLLDDPALRARLRKAARAKASAKFYERIVIDKTLAVYRELLGEDASRAGVSSDTH